MQKEEALSLSEYVSDKPAPRSRIFLQQNLITLLEEGEKVVHYANSHRTISANEFAILSAGNCLMTEKRPQHTSYRSIMISFDHSVLTHFLVKHAHTLDGISRPDAHPNELPFIVFEKNEFIRNYMRSLRFIRSGNSFISQAKLLLKFEELMLYLLEKDPAVLLSLQLREPQVYSDLELRKAVELNITTNLTLEELAFLCHTSVSTFKRRFQRLYQTTPRQYFLQRKMELAKTLLLQNESPGEVFYKVGYENHSSFSQSFRQVFGISPRDFQEQK